MAAELQDNSVEQTRATLGRWIETRQVIAKQQQDWAVGHEMLKERIGLMQREIESLRKKIDDARQSIGEADKKRADLVTENEGLKALGSALTETISKLEVRTKVLNERLPDPLRDLVKPLSQRLPDDPNGIKMSSVFWMR
jgi:FtsZ-binding cell division protein ZapB